MNFTSQPFPVTALLPSRAVVMHKIRWYYIVMALAAYGNREADSWYYIDDTSNDEPMVHRQEIPCYLSSDLNPNTPHGTECSGAACLFETHSEVVESGASVLVRQCRVQCCKYSHRIYDPSRWQQYTQPHPLEEKHARFHIFGPPREMEPSSQTLEANHDFSIDYLLKYTSMGNAAQPFGRTFNSMGEGNQSLPADSVGAPAYLSELHPIRESTKLTSPSPALRTSSLSLQTTSGDSVGEAINFASPQLMGYSDESRGTTGEPVLSDDTGQFIRPPQSNIFDAQQQVVQPYTSVLNDSQGFPLNSDFWSAPNPLISNNILQNATYYPQSPAGPEAYYGLHYTQQQSYHAISQQGDDGSSRVSFTELENEAELEPTVNAPSTQQILCPYNNCPRSKPGCGFSRNDNQITHRRNVHHEFIPRFRRSRLTGISEQPGHP